MESLQGTKLHANRKEFTIMVIVIMVNMNILTSIG